MKAEKCPWCEHKLTDLWEYEMSDDGEIREVECPSCDKKIQIELSVTYDFSISAKCEDIHELDVGDYWFKGADFLNLKCRKCKSEFYDHSLAGGKYPKLKAGTYKFVGEAEIEAQKRGLK